MTDAAANGSAMIRLENVSKTFPGSHEPAVRELSLEVAGGELVVLLGESGCGKTTTLKMINRLQDPDSGRVLVDGRDVMQEDPVRLRRGIGYVFQNFGLFPHMTVAENVGVVPRLEKWAIARTRERTDELLALVGLGDSGIAERRPSELSGGQQQRVGFARALAAHPQTLLMDEPFGALDPLTRDGLQQDFQAIRRDMNLTCIMVTHDMTEALLLGDRIAVMRAGELVQVGTPEDLLDRPADDYVQRLMETPRRQAALLHGEAGAS